MDTIQQQTPVAPASQPSRSRKIYAWLLLAALAVGAVVVRVVTDSDPKPAAQAVTLRGWAYADGPLQNATLSIETPGGDAVGRPLARETKSLGSFVVRTELAPDFRVTLSSGTVGEQVFTGRLVADVTGFGPNSRAIHVSPLTTLLAAYRDRHPDLSSAQAQRAVRRFVKLPADFEVTGDVRGNEPVFSSAEFLSQAAAAGGIQPFVTRLVAQMDAGARTHAFTGAAENGLIPTPEEAARKLIDMVLVKVANTGLSHVLEAIGLGEPVDAEELRLLAEIQQQVERVQNTVNDISQKLVQGSYDLWASELANIKNLILANMEDLQIAADNDDKALAARVSRSVRRDLAGAKAMQTYHDKLIGPGSTTGAYRAWSNLVKSQAVTFWGDAESKRVSDYFAYQQVIQADLIYLLDEQAKIDGIKPESFAAGDLKNFNTFQEQQQAMKPRPAPEPIDMRTNLMWPRSWESTGQSRWSDVAAQLGAINRSGFRGFGDWRVPTEPEFRALIVGQAKPYEWLKERWSNPPLFANCLADTKGTWCNAWANTVERAGSLTPNGDYNRCQASGLGFPYTAHWTLRLETGQMQSTCDNETHPVWPVRAVPATENYWLK